MLKSVRSYKKLYFNIFSSITLAFILPIIVLGVVFYINFKNIKTNNFNSIHTTKAKNTAALIDEIMYTVENDILTMKNDAVFSNYTPFNSSNVSVASIVDLSDKFNSLKAKYTIIDSIYLYDETTQSIFTNSSGSYAVSDFYDTAWINDLNGFSSIKRFNIRSDSNKKVLSIAANYGNNRFIMINIAPNKLANYIYKYQSFDLAELDVFDSVNKKIFTTSTIPAELSIDDNLFMKGFFQFKVNLNYNNYYAVVNVPKTLLNDEISAFRNLCLTFSLLLLIISIVFSFFRTKYIYKPIGSFLIEINEYMSSNQFNSSDEINFFKNIFTEINDKNQLMSSAIDLYENHIKDYSFKDFVQHKISFDEFKECIVNYKMDILGEQYAILIFTANNSIHFDENSKDLIMKKLNLITVIKLYIQNITKGIFCDIHKDNFILIISSDNTSKLEEDINKIKTIIKQSSEFSEFVVTSSYFSDISNSPEEYLKVMNKVNYYNFFKAAQSSLDNDTKLKEISLPKNIHQDILNSILLCKCDEVTLHINNFIDYLKCVENMDYLPKICFMLISNIEKEFSSRGMVHRDFYKDLEKISDVDELIKYINNICFSLIEYISNSFEEENIYVNKAKDFIKVHYAENIGVTNVSDSLNISYAYLSKLFKHYTQLNIMDYINKVRIDIAKELLSTTEMTIIETSLKVGYNNQQSFQRYFKKFVDLTPGEYRKININKKNNLS